MKRLLNISSFCVCVALVLPVVGCVPPGAGSGSAMNEAEFDQTVQREGVTLVKFGAPRCPPCRQVDAELDRVGEQLGDEVKIVKVNVDENASLSRRFGIGSIPHLVLFKNGQIMDESVGFKSADELIGWVESLEGNGNVYATSVKSNPFFQ